MTKRQLYADIAARHTPKGIRVSPPPTGRSWMKGMAQTYDESDGSEENEEEEERCRPFMQVPEPTTLGRLWTYLHECTHIQLHNSWEARAAEGNNYSRAEAEAEFGALQILEAEGVRVPLRILKARRKYIEFHVREDEKLGAGPCSTVTRILGEFDQRIVALER
jgi:hypothetical protein